jgi:hypothetical protein
LSIVTAERPFPPAPVPAVLAILAIVVVGFALSVAVFYPGYMTVDAAYVYKAIDPSRRGDWQSPVMSLVWGWIDPIAPGSLSMLLLMVMLYWASFALIGLTVARRSPWLGVAVPVLAFVPPAFALMGLIWRDVLFADAWLLAGALAFATARSRPALRWPAQILAMGLVAFGVLLRPNAIIAAPVLALYVLWPWTFNLRRAAIVLLPGALLGYALIEGVYYNLLKAERQKPLHSLLVFDLGGISYFTRSNQFPVTFTPEQTALLYTGKCYDPAKWDYYWTVEPCKFVMDRLEDKRDVMFGQPRLTEAWVKAVTAHPLAWLRHRATFMATFLGRSNLAIPIWELDRPERAVHADNPLFMELVALHNALHPTWLFRPGLWLALAAAACALAWRRRSTASGAFAVGLTASAVVYVLTFFPLGVASDFRYAYWAVLAGLVGAVAALSARNEPEAG